MSNKYYLYGKEKIPLVPYESAWLVVPTTVAKEGRALNRHKADPDHINWIVGENKKIAALLDLQVDRSYPARFLVVRGDLAKIQELKNKHSRLFHFRPCYRTRDGQEVFLTDDVLVRVKPGVKPRELLNALFEQLHWNRKNYRILREEKDRETEGPLVLFRVLETDPEAPLMAANLLGDDKFKNQVVHASPNFLFHSQSSRLPTSPLQRRYDPRRAYFYKNQEEWHLDKVSALDAWTAIAGRFPRDPSRWLGSAKIRVVVIDNGVDKDHPDLKNNLIWPDPTDNTWNFDHGYGDPSCDKGQGTSPDDAHGTACAGMVAARGHLAGIAPGCKIVPLRCSTAYFPDEHIQAFYKAKELGGHIISYSRMPLVPDTLFDKAIQNEITQKTGLGRAMPVFCCAGNTGGQVQNPASIDATIAVGASTPADTRADYSCCGDALDFLAPGGNWKPQGLQLECKIDETILTTDICGPEGYNADPAVLGGVPLNNYVWTCGTSFATPLAAGVAALMLTVNENLSPDEIREILCLTADEIEPGTASYQPSNAQGQRYPYGSFSQTHGYGRINAAAAIKEVIRRLRRFPP